MSEREERRRYMRCSFCGKGADQVLRMVAGPGVFICNECVELCVEVFKDDARRDAHPAFTAEQRFPGLASYDGKVANMFARGISVEAIELSLALNQRLIE